MNASTLLANVKGLAKNVRKFSYITLQQPEFRTHITRRALEIAAACRKYLHILRRWQKYLRVF